MKDYDQPDRPRSSVNVSNIEKVRLVIRKDRTLDIRARAGMVNFKRGSVRRILTD